jgi:cytochrome c oxidase cbb3-type subunit 3
MRCVHNLTAAAALLALLVVAGEATVLPSRALAQQQATPTISPKHVAVGGRRPPTAELKNPLAGNAKAARIGEKMFAVYNCDGCHASGGVGAVGPNLADGRFRYGGTDADIFTTIYGGRPDGMPAFGGALDRNTIWHLVAYIRSLKPKEDVSTVSW